MQQDQCIINTVVGYNNFSRKTHHTVQFSHYVLEFGDGYLYIIKCIHLFLNLVLKHINFKVVRCLRVGSLLFLFADGTGFILEGISNINQYQQELLMDQWTPIYC